MNVLVGIKLHVACVSVTFKRIENLINITYFDGQEMTEKSKKVAALLLAAGGAAVGIYLVVKYHKNIIRKFSKAKNVILYDYAKLQRTNFQVEIINDSSDCHQIIATLKQ